MHLLPHLLLLLTACLVHQASARVVFERPGRPCTPPLRTLPELTAVHGGPPVNRLPPSLRWCPPEVTRYHVPTPPFRRVRSQLRSRSHENINPNWGMGTEAGDSGESLEMKSITFPKTKQNYQAIRFPPAGQPLHRSVLRTENMAGGSYNSAGGSYNSAGGSYNSADGSDNSADGSDYSAEYVDTEFLLPQRAFVTWKRGYNFRGKRNSNLHGRRQSTLDGEMRLSNSQDRHHSATLERSHPNLNTRQIFQNRKRHLFV